MKVELGDSLKLLIILMTLKFLAISNTIENANV